jgi:hypothetical protein
LDLGDERRTKRLVALADEIYQHPGGTLPDKLPNPPGLRALYRLMDCEQVTHETLMGAHTAATRQAIAEAAASQPGTVFLILHDATELDYSTLQSLTDDLGQIGQGTQRGYICHNSLVVQAEPQLVFGLGSQILHHRADVPEHETNKQLRERENRESRLWVQGASQCGPAPAGAFCVDVSDRLSDTFEYMAYEVTEQRYFVLRARENRKLSLPIDGEQYLFDVVRKQPAVDNWEITVRPTANQSARKAKVSISFVPVQIAPPRKRSGDYEHRPLDLWGIRVWEPKPPRGAERLEWILLTNVPVQKTDQAKQRVTWYESRVIVEEYHKAMKTGCGIETLQFTRIERLEPAIALLSAVATTLLRLRDAARQPDADTRSATDVVESEYVEVLKTHYPKRLQGRITVKQFYLHVARLGGHQNRKCDGMPGWITLWRGWMKLELLVIGYRLALRRAARMRRNCGKT